MNRECEDPSYGNQRVGIFMDTYNLYVTGKDLHNSKIDYLKLLPELAADRPVIIAKCYLMVKDEKKAEPFANALKFGGLDVEIKSMEFKQYGERNQEKERRLKNASNWDIGITIDMIKWFKKLDTIILVSGNSTYCEAIQYLKSFGVRIEIAGFERSTSEKLIELADDFINIGPDREDGNSIPAWLTAIPLVEDLIAR